MKTLFWKNYPDIEKSLQLTNDLLVEELNILQKNNYQNLYHIVKNIGVGSGKLLRPGIVFLFNKIGPNPALEQDVVPVATAMEVLHLATLVHDDVIDNSPLRRHQTTIHTEFGNRNAIYTGDFLFTIFFDLLTNSILDIQMLRQNSNQMKKILLGELDQMKGNWNFDFTVEEYLTEVKGKTAVLFGLSALNGISMSNGSKKECQNAYEFGINLGIAFQMADDLLDFGETKKTGKPSFEDMKNGVFTLPVIFALQNDQGQLRKELEQINNLINTDSILEHIYHQEGVTKTKKLLDEYLNRAYENLNQFKPSRQKEMLKEILILIRQQVKK